METRRVGVILTSEPFLHVLRPGPDFRLAWEEISPLLSRACAESNGAFSLGQILDNLEHWPILTIVRAGKPQAVMVTAISQRPDGKRVLHCLLASGEDAHQWVAVDEEFDAFARSMGCSIVRIDQARKGWAKRLPHWTIKGYVMEREV